MAVAVAPSRVEVGLAVLEAFQRIIHVGGVLGRTYIIRYARCAVHIQQEFGTLVYELLAGAAGAEVGAVALRRVADDVGLAVGSVNRRTVGSAHDALGLTVLVPVVGGDIRLVVLEVPEVRTAVYPPQQCAVELEDLYAVVVRTGIVGTVGLTPLFHNEFHLSVAVDISHGGIVGLKGIGDVGAVLHRVALWTRNLEVSESVAVSAEHLCGRDRSRLLQAVDDSPHRIGAGGRAGGVGIVADRQRCAVDLHAVAVQIVFHSIVFLSENTPRAVDAVRRFHGDESSVELVHKPLSRCWCRHYQRHCRRQEYLMLHLST